MSVMSITRTLKEFLLFTLVRLLFNLIKIRSTILATYTAESNGACKDLILMRFADIGTHIIFADYRLKE